MADGHGLTPGRRSRRPAALLGSRRPGSQSSQRQRWLRAPGRL